MNCGSIVKPWTIKLSVENGRLVLREGWRSQNWSLLVLIRIIDLERDISIEPLVNGRNPRG